MSHLSYKVIYTTIGDAGRRHDEDSSNMSSEKPSAAFLTTEEVLGCLKVNPRTIYRLIKSGALPAVRIGRQWRFRKADLDQWIDRHRTATS
jgi:excisionase family DNA binding protein